MTDLSPVYCLVCCNVDDSGIDRLQSSSPESCVHGNLISMVCKAFPLAGQPVYSSDQALHPTTVVGTFLNHVQTRKQSPLKQLSPARELETFKYQQVAPLTQGDKFKTLKSKSQLEMRRCFCVTMFESRLLVSNICMNFIGKYSTIIVELIMGRAKLS